MQEKEITRVGGVDAVAIDVRIVAATHRDRPADIDVLGTKLIANALGRADRQEMVKPLLKLALPAMKQP